MAGALGAEVFALKKQAKKAADHELLARIKEVEPGRMFDPGAREAGPALAG